MSDSISGSLLEFQTISGAYIHAEEKLTSSGTLSVERQALFTGGTLSVPGIAFADAPNTGLRQVTVGSDTQLQFINDGIATMSVSNFADQQYYPRVAIGKNISDYTALDVYTQISGYAASFVNDFNGFGNAHGLYVSTLQDDGDYLARFVSNSTDKFTVLTSGNVGVGTDAPKAKLAVVGTISGTTLYATQSFSGAGLTDCDTGATSKLLWDATTGRFSCGTDQGGGSGMNQADADLRFLKLSGGTLTGALTIQNGNTHIPTLSTMLNVRGTISGAMLRAGNMTVSGAVVYSSGNTLMQTAKGLSGQLLIAQGTNAPKWATPVGGMMWYFDGTQAVATSKGPQITIAVRTHRREHQS
jgi:hypothetical protein